MDPISIPACPSSSARVRSNVPGDPDRGGSRRYADITRCALMGDPRFSAIFARSVNHKRHCDDWENSPPPSFRGEAEQVTPPMSALQQTSTEYDAAGLLRGDRGDRYTIGALLDRMTLEPGGYEEAIRDALHETCRTLGVNLLLIYGHALEANQTAARKAPDIYGLIRRGSVDGLIAVSSTLEADLGTEGLAGFLQQFPSLPMCSLGIAVPEVPSIVVSGKLAVAELMDHMIVQHGCRRPLFVAGRPDHPESEEREAAFRDSLLRHGLSFCQERICVGNFARREGLLAVSGCLSRGVEFDAVIAANDYMALGAMEALRDHGCHVPEEIPVTGFDDLLLARVGAVPLTSVSQPFAAEVNAAVRCILDQIANRSVADTVVLPARLIVRQSCGCALPALETLSGSRLPSMDSGCNQRRLEASEAALERALERLTMGRRETVCTLVSGLRAFVEGSPKAFLLSIESVLEISGDASERSIALQGAIDELRVIWQGEKDERFESLWHDARKLVVRILSAICLSQGRRLHTINARFAASGSRLSSERDRAGIRRVLEEVLPTLGFSTAFFSVFDSEHPSELVPLVAYREGSESLRYRASFASEMLVPPGAYPKGYRHTTVVFPLTERMESYGVAALQYYPGTLGHHVVVGQVAAALRNVALHQQVVYKTLLHERSVQERLATAKRLQALSVLAGSVAHDLNNALGPLVALPEVILRELDRLSGDEVARAEVRGDVLSIKSASLRAAQTITDLLTLGRRGSTSKKVLDVNRFVADCVAEEPTLAGARRGANLTVELGDEVLPVMVAESQLARALVNLVRNAVEATAGAGQVRIWTWRRQIEQFLSLYECIDPGDYVVISVSDTGSGIPAQELSRVFEPYYSRKTLSQQSGTGLGLAIVHGVVKEHAGYVDVSSVPGAGTTFSVYLPRTTESTETRSLSLAPPTTRASILLVDDEPAQLRTGRRILAYLGHRVDVLGNGAEAQARFARAAMEEGKSPYDLVILDMLLNEDCDGLELFERIRCLYPEQRAIIVSGYAAPERAEEALRRGLIWLVKPYTAGGLGRAISVALGNDAD